jgi:hypothetical protein
MPKRSSKELSVTLTLQRPMKPEAISKLKADLRGKVILSEDGDYDEALKVYNEMIDKRPQLIVRCVNPADVRLAVTFARGYELAVAVRGGGHNGVGLATCDDGIVIDLSQRRGVRFDPSMSTLRAEALKATSQCRSSRHHPGAPRIDRGVPRRSQ